MVSSNYFCEYYILTYVKERFIFIWSLQSEWTDKVTLHLKTHMSCQSEIPSLDFWFCAMCVVVVTENNIFVLQNQGPML